MFNVGEVGEGYPKQHWVTTQNLCFHPAKYGTRVCLPFWAPFWCLGERNFWQSAKPSLQICRLPFTVRAAPAYLFNVYVRKVSQAPQTITLPKAYLVCEIFLPLVNGSSVAKMFVWCSVWQPLNRRGCHLCPLLSPTSLPPPDMSTLVKSWPYRELYGLIRAPLRWDRARHVFVRGVVRHREEEAGMRRSLHQFGQPFSFGGQPPQAIAYLTCKAATKRGGVVPKVNCRIWGVGGGFEITSWGEIAAGKNYCRPPFRARNWGDCKKLEPVRLHETFIATSGYPMYFILVDTPIELITGDGLLPFHHLPMVSYHRKPLKTMGAMGCHYGLITGNSSPLPCLWWDWGAPPEDGHDTLFGIFQEQQQLYRWRCFGNLYLSVEIFWNPFLSVEMFWKPFLLVEMFWKPFLSVEMFWNPFLLVEMFWNPFYQWRCFESLFYW